MTRLDRDWATARTVTDLGGLTARWLTGGLRRHPNGYTRSTLDPETRNLIPVLVRANRAGFVTDSSQPGFAGRGYDRAQWEQRAAVDGWIADEGLLERILAAAEQIGAVTVQHRPHITIGPEHGIVVTRRNRRPQTSFGTRLSRRALATVWRGLHADAYDALHDATHLTVVDRDYGPSPRLWDALDKAVR